MFNPLSLLEAGAGPLVTLTVDGHTISGWTALEARVSIEQAAGAFTLRVSERPSVDGLSALPALLYRAPEPEPSPLVSGGRCVLRLGAAVVVSGYIDQVTRSLSATEHTVDVSGRDATADLVDCSIAPGTGSFKDQDIQQIASALVAPFVDVNGQPMQVSMGEGDSPGVPFQAVRAEPGETVFAFIERLARHRGLLVMSDGLGGLVLGTAGSDVAPADLVEGENLIAIQATSDWSKRYSDYIVIGQTTGTDDRSGKEAAERKATAQDSEVSASRKRPLVVRAEDAQEDLQARADWEARTRTGRGLTVTATVQGWEAQPGVLWRHNTLVTVQAPTVGVTERLLIVGCVYRLSERGTLTTLDLSRPDGYSILATPEAKDGKSEWWK